MTAHIAVDVGGTQMRAACYSSDSQTPLCLERIATHSDQAKPLDRLNELIASVWPTVDSVAAIGLAVPGPTDPYQGIILEAPNISGWENIPLRKLLQERFHVPVALGNDANMAALGEWKYGIGQGHHHLVYLTVSTGIGGGVIIDDRLLLGQRGLAAELGHITVMPDGPLCGCGKRGHLEAVASGTAIAHWVEAQLNQGTESILKNSTPVTGKMITEAANQGDNLAIASLARAGTFIGQAIGDFLNVFNPSLVIIGGGVSRSGHFLIEPMNAAIKERAMNPEYYTNLTLTTAALGDEAGLYGALALARSFHAISS